jgi:hypothetical protein
MERAERDTKTSLAARLHQFAIDNSPPPSFLRPERKRGNEKYGVCRQFEDVRGGESRIDLFGELLR